MRKGGTMRSRPFACQRSSARSTSPDAGFGPKARERQTGHFQAVRLGISRFFGTYTEIAPGESAPPSDSSKPTPF